MVSESIIRNELRYVRVSYGKDPDLIIFNNPTLYDLYPKYIYENHYCGVTFIVNEKSRIDVSFYMYDDSQDLILVHKVTFPE